MTATPRASLYLRLSKEAGTTNLSLEGMATDLREVCAREGFREVALHVDNGLSGAVRNRPAFRAWLADASEGRADVLVGYRVDRMTREGMNAAALLLDVVEGKDPFTGKADPSRAVRLMDAQGLDSNDGEGFRWRFLAAAEGARSERAYISDRNRAADERLRRSGRWAGGSPPFGYRLKKLEGGKGTVLDIDPEEAETIRAATRAVLSGTPLLRVALQLNEAGHKPRRAKAWSRTSLRNVLTGESILGRVVVHGGVLRDDDGRAVTPFPAIVTLEESQALRAILATKPRASRPVKRARLLSGLLNCHSCGSPLHVSFRSEHGGGGPLYRCPTRKGGGVCTSPVAIGAEVLEEYLVGEFLDAVGGFEHYERRMVAPAHDPRAELDEAIAATGAELTKRFTMEVAERLQRLQAERDAVAAEPPAPAREEWVATGRTVREVWEAGDLATRQAILGRWYLEVVVGPGTRGAHGLDPERLTVTTVADSEDGELPVWDLD